MTHLCRLTTTVGLAGLLVDVNAQALLAHPGHAVEVIPASAPGHWWLQPEHAAIWIVALVTSAVLWALRRGRTVSSEAR